MTTSIQNILKKITAFFTKKNHRRFFHDASSDWKHILIISIIFMFIIIAVDGYLFFKISRGELFSTENSSINHVPAFNRALLDSENNYYDGLETSFQNASHASTTAIDPSL